MAPRGGAIELHENAIRLPTFHTMIMKTSFVYLLAAMAAAGVHMQAQAQQERVWRCGNEYTNNAAMAQQRGCKVMEGGNVTVVQGSRPVAAAAPSSGGAVRAPAGSPRVESVDQRARDGEARSVLESELKKAEERQAQLLREYNNGEPEKQGSESRNYQKYLDRVAEMKAEIARNESDIAGIRREIGRLPATR
ncbi:hypothetical protein RA8CHR_04503 [Variovorax sp. RA8]|nr:hypothetical protein RA8CHR_04503 [Variovorax sp. RA8]